MRVLFDQGTPQPLREWLTHHDVSTAYELGWSRLSNGELLVAAERDGFDLLVTTDTNLKNQQDLKARSPGVVVLLSTSWPRIRKAVASVVEAVDGAGPGTYVEVEIPLDPS
jgi:hypothetical protein